MAKNLPGLNYDSRLSIDDLTFQSDETEKAILDRTTIVFGNRALLNPRFGVIDVVDPKNIVSEETTRPLLVYTSAINPLNINITSGSAVTPNGAIIVNTTLIENFSLARTAVDDINVVFLENEIIDAPPKRKTRYNVDQYTRRIQSPNVIRVALLSDFQNSILFPPTRTNNIIVIAIVTVVQNTSSLGKELHFDYTNSSYSFNRPWYSPVDIEHRSKLGSGTVTEKNTHGMAFNDLTSGNLTLYDQVLAVGCIQARDDLLKGIPGTPCYETIDPSRILTDGATNGITSESRFGGLGAKYIQLANYPVNITSFYLQSHKGRDIAWDYIKGTKIIVLPNPETFTSTAIINYNRIFSVEPPAQIFSNNLVFGQPDTTKEQIITEGLSLTELANQFIDFDGSGPVPRLYTLYVKGDGTLLKTPQPIQTPFLLDDIGTMLTPISATFFGPSRIGVGLSGATSGSSMSIVIRLTGRDIDGNALTEDITFSSSWSYTPYLEDPNQSIKTTYVYNILNSIQVISRSNDGPNSKIQLWAELETQTTVALARLAKVASVMWDGTGIADLKDLRKISTIVPSTQHRFQAAASIYGVGNSPLPVLVYSEDFANPLLKCSTEGTQTATAAIVRIGLNYLRITPAYDTITFPNSKILHAVSSSPNRTAGEFAAYGSDSQTRDDMILTLNSVGFASGYTAVADSSYGDNTALITANTTGARGNGVVTINQMDITQGAFTILPVDGVSVSGLVNGIDSFGECFIPKHFDYIDTDIPNSLTYEVSSYRYRYLSVPLPIANKHTIRVIVHGLEAPQTNIQVRMRFATSVDPTWLPWEVLTGTGSLFSITKIYAISKIQVQLFGKASGFSVYEVG